MLRGVPIAVSGDPKSRTVVAAASKEAKRFGVKSAMTIGEARRLCPQIQFILGDPDKYVEVSRRVIGILGDFTPDVEVTSIDEAFLDVTGWTGNALAGPAAADPLRARSLRAQGDPPSASPACSAIFVAQEIKRRIREEVGEWITCSIGIAPNKRLAKLASEFKKPDGLVVVTDGVRGGGSCFVVSRAELLSSLKLRDLCGIGARIEARLNAMGITTVGALAAASMDRLAEEFGSYGRELHDMALGIDASSVDAEDAAPKSMGHATTLPKDLKTLAELQPVVDELAEKVASRLRRHGYRASTIHVTLRFRDFTSRGEQTTIPDATDDGLRISREVIRMLSDRGLRQPVRLVGVSVSKLVCSNPEQVSLLSKDRRWRAATAALDQANDRYGDWTVQRASLLVSERVSRKVAAAFRATRHLKNR